MLTNSHYRDYLKLQLTKEFCTETMIFYEEVELFKVASDEERIKKLKLMVDAFFTVGTPNEINISSAIKKIILSKFEKLEAPINIFDDVIADILFCSFEPALQRLLKTDLIIEMQQTDESDNYLTNYDK